MPPLRLLKEPMPEISTSPPHSVETEQHVLAIAMAYPESAPQVVAALTPQDFYRRAHQAIFFAISKCVTLGQPIDMTLVCEHLKQMRMLDKVGGRTYVTDIAMSASTRAGLIEWHVPQLKKYAALRAATNLAMRVQEAVDSGDEPEAIIQNLQVSLSNMAEQLQPPTRGLSANVSRVIARIKQLHQTGELPGITTGFAKLDHLTLGYQEGQLIIVGGRSGTGKTHFAVTTAYKLASQGKHVAVFSLETSGDSFTTRLLAHASSLASGALRRGWVGPTEWTSLERAANIVSALPITIIERKTRKVSDIERHIRALMASDVPPALIEFDHIQLLQAEKDGMTKQQVVERGSQTFKELALELGVPIMALSQLNREAEGTKPELKHLKDAGIEADADIAILIHRNKQETPHEAELIVAKNRDGEEGSIPVWFNAATSSFFESRDELIQSRHGRF